MLFSVLQLIKKQQAVFLYQISNKDCSFLEKVVQIRLICFIHI